MSKRDFIRYLYGESQVDADTEATLQEAALAAKLETRKTPLVKALKELGISTENITVDECGGKLTFTDIESWHEAVTKLGTIEAMNSLADEGWVPEFAGDTAHGANSPSEFTLNFLCLHVVEPSEQDKASSASEFNKEVETGADTVIPKEQKERDAERKHGVKESLPSEADQLLEAPEDGLSTEDAHSQGRANAIVEIALNQPSQPSQSAGLSDDMLVKWILNDPVLYEQAADYCKALNDQDNPGETLGSTEEAMSNYMENFVNEKREELQAYIRQKKKTGER